MDYNNLINIRGVDIEGAIKESILETKEYLSGLTNESTCYIYSSKVYECLRKRGIIARLVDTGDFGEYYSHKFVLVPFSSDKYYLIDLTYEQFIRDDNYIKELYLNGYILLEDGLFNKYLSLICNDFDYKVDEVFYSNKK